MIDEKKMDLYVWRYVAISSAIIATLITFNALISIFNLKFLSDSVLIALISSITTISISLIVKAVFKNESN